MYTRTAATSPRPSAVGPRRSSLCLLSLSRATTIRASYLSIAGVVPRLSSSIRLGSKLEDKTLLSVLEVFGHDFWEAVAV